MAGTIGTSRLNKYLQEKGRLTSLSWKESISGPANAKIWTVVCKIDGKEYGKGSASQKHVAKDKASDLAWATLTAENP